MTGPGRPPIGPAIKVRLDDELRLALDLRAGSDGVKRAELIRQLLREGLLRDALTQLGR